jgi:hypothetical protein
VRSIERIKREKSSVRKVCLFFVVGIIMFFADDVVEFDVYVHKVKYHGLKSI